MAHIFDATPYAVNGKKMQPDLRNIRIVLVEPQGAFNIGSVARVMKNMGLSELALVNPAEYQNDEAYKGSVGAKNILNGALVYRSIEDADGAIQASELILEIQEEQKLMWIL